MSVNISKNEKGLWELFKEPFNLTTGEKIVVIRWFVCSIGLGTISLWLPPLLRSIEEGNKYESLIFVLNGSLFSFLVVALTERISSLYSKISINKEDTSGMTQDIDRKSKNMIIIFCTVTSATVLISISMYTNMVMSGATYSDRVQWIIFSLGLFLWFYLLCMTINGRWEESVNEGYTVQKDDDQRESLMNSLDSEKTQTKDGMEI